MENNKKYYITTPIYYPSGKFHVGHCYCTVVADTIAKYKRLKGYDVFFLTGTDEHGQKIEQKAEEANKTPKQYVDEIVADTKDLWEKLGVKYDKYIRTTDEQHVKCVEKVFKKLYDQGDIYFSSYEGKYCTPCESFWTETQLVDGKCPDCGRDVELVKEESYFFRLSKYQDRILKYYEENVDFLEPVSRKNEMVENFIKKGLNDLCVSRTSVKWGIKVPFDPKHTVYVWIDALSNYISSLGYLSDDEGLFNKYWPADLHLVGKEIFRFHSIIWIAFLMALDLPLPKKIYGHGWLIVDGAKISKSRGNYKDPRVYIDETSVDALRYFLLHEVTFGQDGNFSEEMFIEKSNSDLSNDLGNLVSRVTAMVQKYNNGILKQGSVTEDYDEDLIKLAISTKALVETSMDNLKINDALSKIWDLIRFSNKYIDLSMPWVLAKGENYERLNTVLYNLCESIRIISVLLKPFLVETPEKIFKQLGINDDESLTNWESTGTFGLIKDGTNVIKGENIFPRIEIKKAEVKENKESEKKVEEQKEENSGIITIDELDKVKLKVGQIKAVERVENSDKLYKLSVDLGEQECRTIVSGLVSYYKEEELLNKQVVVVANLKKAKLRGVESNGMLLAAGDGDVVKLLVLDSNAGTLENGANIH